MSLSFHFANACHSIICFNCEKTGHLVSDCPAPVACNICKATNHLARKCPFSWTTISEIPSVNDVGNTPPVPSTNTPMDNNDQSLKISQSSVGPATAHQFDQMESDASITPDEHQLTDKELSTVSKDEDENFQDSAKLFEPSTENISPTPTPNPPLPNGRKPAKHINSSAPTRIATQPTLITGKGRELSDKSDENTPLPKCNHSRNRTNKHKKHRPKKTSWTWYVLFPLNPVICHSSLFPFPYNSD